MSLKTLKSNSDSTSLTILSDTYGDPNYDFCVNETPVSSAKGPASSNSNFLQASYGIEENQKYRFLEKIQKNFKSMYVLSFAQSDDIMEYFKELISEETEETEEPNVLSYQQKKQKCKYLHLIIQNPVDKRETFEIGVKIIDIIHSKINY